MQIEIDKTTSNEETVQFLEELYRMLGKVQLSDCMGTHRIQINISKVEDGVTK